MSPEVYERRIGRERRARSEAESLLESRSLELYRVNQELIAARANLERLVEQRTAELQAALERAAAMAAARSRFLAVISHEIRTPISGVIGLLDLIDSTAEGSERDAFLRSAKAASGHLLDLVNDVLDLAKIDAGKLVILPQPFAPAELASEVEALLRPALAQKPVSLRVRLMPGLPPTLTGDSHRLRQILLNFASNAVKFTETGFVEIRLSGAPGPDGRLRFRIEVEDSGAGIPEDQQAQLFDEFVQADLVRHRQIKGTGLGLAICKRLAEAMGGTVGLRSAVGSGSTFYVEVPVETGGETRRTVAASTGLQTVGRSILLAEDTPTLQLVVASLLRRAGHRVEVASNGAEALAALEGGGFDLAILDMFMPALDGDEVIRKVRAGEAGPRGLPVLILTAAIDRESLDRIEQAGANQMLPKPVQRDELLAAIEAVMPPGAPPADPDGSLRARL